jgi:hypothetical protein
MAFRHHSGEKAFWVAYALVILRGKGGKETFSGTGFLTLR